MCIKSPKIPDPKPVQPAPQRKDVDVDDERRKIAQRQGVFGNIVTSPLGDSTYGTNTRRLATLGAAA